MASSSHCPVCLDLGGPDDHRGNVQEAIRSKQRGCRGCAVVCWILEPYMKEIVGQSAEVRLRIRLPHDSPKPFHYLCYSGTKFPRRVITELEVNGMACDPGNTLGAYGFEGQSACPWPKLRAAPAISGNTGSDEAVSRVKLWLRDCMDNHSECRMPSIIPPLPTRVLLLESGNKARLHHPNGEAALYACLSHCWGGRTMIQTTTSTLQDHLQGIPWDQLPTTFQDAVSFTYRLGLKYLWIDSLCILQDSFDDWQQEGSKMSTIYGNSYITLAASSSEDAYGGCFVKSKHISRKQTFYNSDSERYEIHCRLPLSSSPAPLQQRGWAFQEELLSKRVVHFMQEELYWECLKGFTCECGEPHSTGVYKSNFQNDLGDSQNIADIDRYWTQIVLEYTERKLTFPSDIFPGLQGLAKLVSPKMGRYLAGHWEATLTQSLCWYVDIGDFQNAKPTSWRAPSWSWASALSPVRYFPAGKDDTCSTFFTVIGASTVPKGTDPTGQLSYGELILKGKCLFGEIAATKTIAPWPAEYKTDPAFMLSKPPPGQTGKYSSPKLFLFEDEKQYLDGNNRNTWFCYPRWDYNFKCQRGMRVLAMKINTISGEFCDEDFWLVLKPRDPGSCVYERLGLILLGACSSDWSEAICSSRQRLGEIYGTAAREMEVTVI